MCAVLIYYFDVKVADLSLSYWSVGSAFGPVVPYKQPLPKTEPPRGTPNWFAWKYRQDPRTPSYWTKYTSWKTLKDWNLDVRTTSHSLEQVNQGVYNSIQAALKSTIGGAKIISIQRVENVHLYQKYAVECQRLCRKASVEGSFTPLDKLNGSKGPVKSMKKLDPSITQHTCPEFNEYYFFHGTNANTVQSICSQGLDSRLAASGRLGSGVYGAEVASKSAGYSGKGKRKQRLIHSFIVYCFMFHSRLPHS